MPPPSRPSVFSRKLRVPEPNRALTWEKEAKEAKEKNGRLLADAFPQRMSGDSRQWSKNGASAGHLLFALRTSVELRRAGSSLSACSCTSNKIWHHSVSKRQLYVVWCKRLVERDGPSTKARREGILANTLHLF